MPYEEFIGWFKFFNKRPIGWREDYRISLLLNAQGVKKKGSEIFQSIKIMENENRKTNGIDHNLLNMLKSAKNGDKWNPIIEE